MASTVIPPNGDTTSPYLGQASVSATSGGTYLWCCTARDRTQVGDQANNVQQRETDTVYMVGLKERVELTTTTDHAWAWRRIVFRVKFTGLQFVTGASMTATETTSGWGRIMRNIRNSGFESSVIGRLFRGTVNQDWSSTTTAPIDTNNVTLMYDKVRTIRSGNAQAVRREYKLWHPMGKNFVYANDEQGQTESSDTFSALGNAGMGDVFVMDFFDCATPSSTSAALNIFPNATLYWHEK